MDLTRRHWGQVVAGTALAVATPGLAAAQSRPTLTIAVDTLWPTMEPVLGVSAATLRMFANFYDPLIQRDYIASPQGLTLAPMLATKWERNGAVWSLQLREGVKFHNGAEMTAEDVAFTLSADRLWGPKPFAPRGKTFTAGFKRVSAVGKYAIEIETDAPDPYMPGKLTGYIGFVVPKAYYLEVGPEKFGLMPIGAGPYRVTKFNPAQSLEMVAFDDYWGAPPPAQKLTWTPVPEFAARLAGLVSGQFDMIVNVPTDQIAAISSYRNVKYVSRPADNYPMFAFNTLPDPPDNPLVDPNLRYAMVQGVNMPQIVSTLFGDATFFPAVPFNFPEYGPFYDAAAKPGLPFDPDAARALVKKTAYKGEKLGWHITHSFFPNYEDAAQIMIEQWREIGVNVEAQILDNFDLVYRRPYHLMNMSLTSNFIPGDPYQPLWLDWGPTSTRATASWKTWTPTQRFLELGTQFAAATDFDARNAAYRALSAEWQRVTPGLFMWKSVYNWAHRTGLTFKPVADSDMRMFGGYLSVS